MNTTYPNLRKTTPTPKQKTNRIDVVLGDDRSRKLQYLIDWYQRRRLSVRDEQLSAINGSASQLTSQTDN